MNCIGLPQREIGWLESKFLGAPSRTGFALPGLNPPWLVESDMLWIDGMQQILGNWPLQQNTICPGCGYGVTELGIVLVTRPDTIINPFDVRLCRDCNPNRSGGRLPSDPPTAELFPPISQ